MEKLNQENYKLLDGWWKGWNLPTSPYSWLSSETYILDNTVAGGIYQLGDGKMFWIEGIVSNPKATNKKEKLIELINFLTKRAEEMGAEIVMTSTPRAGLKITFEELGYKTAPEQYYHLGSVG